MAETSEPVPLGVLVRPVRGCLRDSVDELRVYKIDPELALVELCSWL